MQAHASVAEYIAAQPKDRQAILKKVRAAIRKAAPKAEEGISYGMPAYKQDGPLVYFAAMKHHLGFYPTGKGVEAFAIAFAKYKGSKGAVQFPWDQPIPYDLIARVVKHRISANRAKAAQRGM